MHTVFFYNKNLQEINKIFLIHLITIQWLITGNYILIKSVTN